MSNWLRFALSAAGSGGGNEYLLEGTGSQVFYLNATSSDQYGTLVVHRRSGSNYYWDKYDAGLNFIADQDTGYTYNTDRNRNWYGYPKITTDDTYGYDVVSSMAQEYFDNMNYLRITQPGSTGGSRLRVNSAYIYGSNDWQYGQYTRTFNIGDRTYVCTNAYGSYGGAVGSFKHTATTGLTTDTDPAYPGHSNNYGSGSMIDMLPINPNSQSTDFVVLHASAYYANFYKLNSSLQTYTTGASANGIASNVEYFSNMVLDTSSNKAFIYNSNIKYLIEYDYSANNVVVYSMNFAGTNIANSNWLTLVNGSLYLYLPSGNGLYLVKMNPSNITSGVQSYKLTNTSGSGVGDLGSQDGFLIEGPNTFLTDTDLLYLGFTNYADSGRTQGKLNLAVVKWDSIPNIANFNSTCSITSGGVSLTNLGSISSPDNQGSTMYGINTVSPPTETDAYSNSSEASFGTKTGPTALV